MSLRSRESLESRTDLAVVDTKGPIADLGALLNQGTMIRSSAEAANTHLQQENKDQTKDLAEAP